MATTLLSKEQIQELYMDVRSKLFILKEQGIHLDTLIAANTSTITEEVTRATNAENSISNNLSQEVTDRGAAISAATTTVNNYTDEELDLVTGSYTGSMADLNGLISTNTSNITAQYTTLDEHYSEITTLQDTTTEHEELLAEKVVIVDENNNIYEDCVLVTTAQIEALFGSEGGITSEDTPLEGLGLSRSFDNDFGWPSVFDPNEIVIGNYDSRDITLYLRVIVDSSSLFEQLQLDSSQETLNTLVNMNTYDYSVYLAGHAAYVFSYFEFAGLPGGSDTPGFYLLVRGYLNSNVFTDAYKYYNGIILEEPPLE